MFLNFFSSSFIIKRLKKFVTSKEKKRFDYGEVWRKTASIVVITLFSFAIYRYNRPFSFTLKK